MAPGVEDERTKKSGLFELQSALYLIHADRQQTCSKHLRFGEALRGRKDAMSGIKDTCELRAIYPAPKERALGKVISHLDRHCSRFIELSPFCILGSTDAKGRPELSPRGGEPGFVKVIDPGA